ncbi:MAG: hypothetical protein AAF409_20745 [Pseudomonadota bacterium]
MRRSLILGVTIALAAAMTAMAGPPSERVFSQAALDHVQSAQEVVYTHERDGEAKEQLFPVDGGEIRVSVDLSDDGGREALVTMGQPGQLRPVSKWPASSGSPLVPIFLESVLRSMARVTGGSEFYIRNRIKEALGQAGTMTDVERQVEGKTVLAQEIVFEPFATDKNRDRMGPFAELTLTFVVSTEVPGDVISFTAATVSDASVYSEEIAFRTVMVKE